MASLEEHLETFLHVSHRVARTAAKEDMKQRGYTQIVNDSASRSVCVPFTSKCWLTLGFENSI